VNGEHKITSSHRGRTALIYLRQSSMAQLREHTESTRSQYALAGKAAELGWARSDIEVIDADLGISGKWGVAREGFTELVTRVCGGEVGAIFGIEITRLARSNADVARLAEFARITGTLLIDPDGVYDPADVNDRVLLGFKGTMGEMLCRIPDKASQGFPSNRSSHEMLGPGPRSIPASWAYEMPTPPKWKPPQASYADIAVMPTNRREHPAGRDDG
jgi:Resolvase, N terminal domain